MGSAAAARRSCVWMLLEAFCWTGVKWESSNANCPHKELGSWLPPLLGGGTSFSFATPPASCSCLPWSWPGSPFPRGICPGLGQGLVLPPGRPSPREGRRLCATPDSWTNTCTCNSSASTYCLTYWARATAARRGLALFAAELLAPGPLGPIGMAGPCGAQGICLACSYQLPLLPPKELSRSTTVWREALSNELEIFFSSLAAPCFL